MDTLPDFSGGAFDARGNGQVIEEYAEQEWPGYVYQVMITTRWYSENFPKLKELMENGKTNIPDDSFIRDDFRVVGLKSGARAAARRISRSQSNDRVRVHGG